MNRKNIWIYFLLTMCLLMFFQIDLDAQCPMCKMSAESNLKNGGSAGKGLNDGILYMLSLPYLLVAALAFIWWRNTKADKEDELARQN